MRDYTGIDDTVMFLTLKLSCAAVSAAAVVDMLDHLALVNVFVGHVTDVSVVMVHGFVDDAVVMEMVAGDVHFSAHVDLTAQVEVAFQTTFSDDDNKNDDVINDDGDDEH